MKTNRPSEVFGSPSAVGSRVLDEKALVGIGGVADSLQCLLVDYTLDGDGLSHIWRSMGGSIIRIPTGPLTVPIGDHHQEGEEMVVLPCGPAHRRRCNEILSAGAVCGRGNEKVLSPAVTSPFVPSSNNAWWQIHRSELKSHVTVMPVLTGSSRG